MRVFLTWVLPGNNDRTESHRVVAPPGKDNTPFSEELLCTSYENGR